MTMTHDEMMARFYARDRTANGSFITGVVTTGIYCLPSCAARKLHVWRTGPTHRAGTN